MRSLFKGVVGFGLVAIPIQLYRALDAERIPLHWVHRDCGTRIQYVKRCPACQRPVDAGELAHGAEADDGRLIVVDEPELLGQPDDRRESLIQILTFHPAAEIDIVFYGDAYWAEPGQGGRKPYRLLWQAMQHRRQVAVAEMRLRRRRQLALVRPYGSGAIMLHAMHYPENVRMVGAQFGTPAGVSVTSEEERLAEMLLEQLTEPFDPAHYPDRAKARLRRWIDERAALAPANAPAPGTVLGDLVAQLRASVAAAQSVGGGPP